MNNPLALITHNTHNNTHNTHNTHIFVSVLSLVPAQSPCGDWGPSRCVQYCARASPLSSPQQSSPPLAEIMSKSKKEILPMVGMGYTRKIEENYTFVLYLRYAVSFLLNNVWSGLGNEHHIPRYYEILLQFTFKVMIIRQRNFKILRPLYS